MSIDPDTIAFAHKLADTSGEVIRPYFRQRIEISDKGLAKGGVFDPVTAADSGGNPTRWRRRHRIQQGLC